MSEAEKRRCGRPPKFATPEELDARVEEYFNGGGMRTKTITTKAGLEVEVPFPTMTDLCLFLGFCDRQSFYDYEKRPPFSCTLKKARTLIEREYEEMLRSGTPTGAIFALKNFGWRDKQEIDHTSGGEKLEPTRIVFERSGGEDKEG